MSFEQKNQTQKPITELIRNAADFDELQATELAQKVGEDLQGLLSGIGLDNKLLDAYKKCVTNPVEVQSDGIVGGERSGYAYDYPETEDEPKDPVFIISLGRKSVERWSGMLQEAYDRNSLSFEYEGQAYDLTTAWMLSHELGHGLQEAHDFIHRRPSEWREDAWVYPINTREFLKKHPEEALAANEDDASLIEAEREAEGIANLYTRNIMVTAGGLDEEQATQIADTVHELFAELAAPAVELLKTTPPEVILREATKDRDGGRLDVLRIGYSMPLTEAELVQRFALKNT